MVDTTVKDWCASLSTCFNSTKLKTRCFKHFYVYKIYIYTGLLLLRPRQKPFTFEIGSSLSVTRIQVNYCPYRDHHNRLIVNIIHCETAGTYNGSGTYLIFGYDFLIKNSCCSRVGSCWAKFILGDPGVVSRVGKGGTKVCKYGQESPWGPAPDWAQKMLCIIVTNRRTVSPEFFSWVHTRRLFSRYTCPVRSPSLCVQGKLKLFSTFLTRNEGTTDESKKRLRCYQQEQFNLPREHSVFDGSQCIVSLRCGADEKLKKAIVSQGKTITLHVHHAFLYISLPSTARLPVKMPNFAFCEGRK